MVDLIVCKPSQAGNAMAPSPGFGRAMTDAADHGLVSLDSSLALKSTSAVVTLRAP